jgi:outer membrane putative beta-barrel porin/alpha-amylase
VQRLCCACLLFFATQLQAAHPLITEDTGTQGKGGWQLEILGEDGKARGTGAPLERQDAVLSHGVTVTADVQVGLPWTRQAGGRGTGDVSLDLKWRFLERGPLSLGLKPGITLPTGDEAKGLGAGRAAWGTLFILSYDAGSYAIHAHAGYKRNRNDFGERESLVHTSGAVTVRAAPEVKVVFDYARTTSADPAATQSERYLVFGAIWSPRKDLDLDLGLKVGSGAAALDEALLLGMTVRW